VKEFAPYIVGAVAAVAIIVAVHPAKKHLVRRRRRSLESLRTYPASHFDGMRVCAFSSMRSRPRRISRMTRSWPSRQRPVPRPAHPRAGASGGVEDQACRRGEDQGGVGREGEETGRGEKEVTMLGMETTITVSVWTLLAVGAGMLLALVLAWRWLFRRTMKHRNPDNGFSRSEDVL
jgi:hypothetical protein